jgi:hypothetical protein
MNSSFKQCGLPLRLKATKRLETPYCVVVVVVELCGCSKISFTSRGKKSSRIQSVIGVGCRVSEYTGAKAVFAHLQYFEA